MWTPVSKQSNKTVNAIVQARCGSSRFPNKIFERIDGKPLIWHVVNRLTYSQTINNIIVATTINAKDDLIVKWCKENMVNYYRGSENDVLNRYHKASESFPSDIIVRITADDPFKEPSVIDKVVNTLIAGGYDFVTNNYPPTYPEGLDCEAFTFETLKKIEESAKEDFEREHVTQYVYHNHDNFKIANISYGRNLSFLRWTIDTQEDIDMVRTIYANRDHRKAGVLLMEEILDILEKKPEISKINSNVERSAMY